jgi:hypothetical protein
VLRRRRNLQERVEGALHDVSRVVRLRRELLVLPPEPLLALVDVAKARVAQPSGQARAASLQPAGAMLRTTVPKSASSAGVDGSARTVE